MTSADDILRQIDNTLDDWTVSDDAMRSRPAVESSELAGFQGGTPSVFIADEVGEWQEIQGAIRADFDMEIDQASIDPAAVNPPAPNADWGTIRDLMIRIDAESARRVQVVLEGLKRAMAQLAAPVGEAAETFAHLPEALSCNDCGPPPPPRDRPAWRSPYGPARRRR